MLSIETTGLQVNISTMGQVQSLLDRGASRELLPAGELVPLLTLEVAGQQLAPTAAEVTEPGKLTLRYGNGPVATVAFAARGTHMTFELAALEGPAVDRAIWGPFPTLITQTVGSVVAVVRDPQTALGLQALNVHTTATAVRRGGVSRLHAESRQREGGVIGSRIALFACRAAEALDAIGRIELAEGLPHPMLDGQWGKVSPTARMAYLITWDFGEGGSRLPALFEMAKRAGLRYIYHGNPFRTWGHFELDPRQFPEGDESLRAYVDSAAEQGLRLGCHTLTGFITTNDPYVTPVPDPRLATWGESTLAEAVDEKSTEVPVAGATPFRRPSTLHAVLIEQELVQYRRVSDDGRCLVGCSRGAFGTGASAHDAGTGVGLLADHGYRTLFPGIDNGMMDEMTRRLVELFNTTGMRQVSFDGLEGLAGYGYPGDYTRNRFVRQCFDGWQVEVINDASNLLHYLWHVHTRMNWGELGQSEKLDVDNYRLANCRFFEDNLFPTAMGWWRLGLGGADWEATRTEDVEYLLAKAAGYNAAHGMQTEPDTIAAHGHGEACLQMVKDWEAVRTEGLLSEAQRARLREKGRDFHLEPADHGEWTLSEIRYSPFHWLCPGTGREQLCQPPTHVLSFNTVDERHLGTTCELDNPFAPQPLRLELRVSGAFDHDAADNIALAPPGGGFQRGNGLSTDAPQVTITEEAVTGRTGYGLAARHDGEGLSRPTRVVATLPEPVDLRGHRGLGLWVRGDANGELLFLELTSGEMVRQYYVPVDFAGERYFEFPLGEACCGRYYSYAPWDGFAAWHLALKGFDYGRVDRLCLGLSRIPGGKAVSCAVAGIKALKELGTPLQSPVLRLGAASMVIEGAFAPWNYLVYMGGDRVEVRDEAFRLQREVPITGDRLELQTGPNSLSVSYSGANGPAPWARVELWSGGPQEMVRRRP